jgi:hypothetical protein
MPLKSAVSPAKQAEISLTNWQKSGKIVGGFLPLILNSDVFWDYTIAHASGTQHE